MPIFPESRFFPPAELLDTEGLAGFGGTLSAEWLLDAYQHGIFPWPIADIRSPIPWWSPDPRAIIEFDEFHVPRRLRRTVGSGRFEVTFDRDFSGVMRACAAAHGGPSETWITDEMIVGYTRLFELGHTHSVEVRRGGRLVGGTYGVAIGGLFAAESKFHLARDASKVALVHLVDHLRQRGYTLFDIQQLTPHMVQFGAVEITRNSYLIRLRDALALSVAFD